VAARARIILLAADGVPNSRIAGEVGVSRPTVILWRTRFSKGGPHALTKIEEGRGRRPSISPHKIAEVISLTTETKPKGETHWSTRSMARRAGVSPATVGRIWDAAGLQPHRVDTFKVSNDPKFLEKLTDVVGLYLNPPDKAVVLCVDEKSQIQALDRTQPSLPMKRGRAGTMTHDYHTHPNVKAWLEKHPRFHLHFTPTSSSWLNLVERWFRELTQKAIRRGVFPSVADLIDAIQAYVDAYNEDPKPFVWTATLDSIIEKVNRCKAILQAAH